VTVLFADLVGFTTLSNGISAEKLVSMLNDIMSAFDLIANQEGVEKIKTIGDCYMLASGIPLARPDHAPAVVRTALAMLAALESFNQQQGANLQIRVGIHSGPVVAGVIGVHKYTYDLWGGTVNIASRMESTGLPGRIQVSTATAQLIRDHYTLESRGPVPIKGIGEVETFLIV
jgi:class 3 adenylate cyclase